VEASVATILVVDDEEPILDLLRRLLEKGGHEVFAARNAEEAIATLGSKRPEIAIVDLVMPGKGGLTLIMENLVLHRDLEVIAMSGRIPVGTDSMLGLGATLRISCFLPKPFTAEELEAAVRTAQAKACA
jgi:DNA-binding response OmpR family regulator